MNPDHRAVIEKVTNWIEIAEEDLRLAKHAFTLNSNIPYRLIAFHSQQCAEKYIKAFLVYHLIDFPYTHQIEKLLSLVPEKYSKSLNLQEAAKLSDYAVTRRYPDFYTRISHEEAEESVQLAESVKSEILKLLRQTGYKVSS
jgi:HEPN domain-containing protein